MTAKDFQVGQLLYVVWTTNARGVPPEWLEVTKVGRKWVELGTRYRKVLRFDPTDPIFGSEGDSFWCDGYGYASPGTVYLDADKYEEHQERQRLWRYVTNSFEHAPAWVSTQRLRQLKEDKDAFTAS